MSNCSPLELRRNVIVGLKIPKKIFAKETDRKDKGLEKRTKKITKNYGYEMMIRSYNSKFIFMFFK